MNRDPDVQADWANALRLFAAAQRARNIENTTIARRVRQLDVLCADLPTPWRVTREDVLIALSELGNVADATRRTYRDSTRAFYRWAYATGRVAEDPASEPSRRASLAPISDEWDAELRAYRTALRAEGLARTSIRLRLTHVRRLGRDHAHRSPWALTLDDLLEWFGTKRWARETRHAVRSSIRSFYAWGKRTGRVRKSPAKKLPPVHNTMPAPRPAALVDYDVALRQARDREKLAMRMAAELGMRCTEVAVARGSDLEGAPGAWTLRVMGKGQKVRYIPVPDSLASVIRGYRSAPLFPGQIDGHLSPQYLDKVVNRTLPHGTTMHMLRHRFATDAYAATRDTLAVQRLLGHASPATTQRYVQVDDSTLRDAVEAVRQRRAS